MKAAPGEDAASSDTSARELEIRSDEIQKVLENAENLKKQKDAISASRAMSPGPSSPKGNDEAAVKAKENASSDNFELKKELQPEEAEEGQPEKGGVLDKKEATKPDQGAEGENPLSPAENVPEAFPEESSLEYSSLENVTWEISEKKIILCLWISGQATPELNVIRDQDGIKMRLRPKGLATRIQRVVSSAPPGVQSCTIREDPKLGKVWGLDGPYYAVDEIQVSFIFPVHYSLLREPGLLKVTFLLPKKVEPKTEEPLPVPEEAIEKMQREALDSPETTLGTSYQAQLQFEDRTLYGAQKPPSLSELSRGAREAVEFKPKSRLPENVRPIFESRHPAFGSVEYFKKYVRGIMRQTVDFTTNYNAGTTSAFRETRAYRGEPGTGGGGKNIGTILWTPAIAVLFYRPGPFDVSTGYSASKDFPTTHNNFLYGLSRQNVNLGASHFPRKRYALSVQNNLGIFGGITRQKSNGKWVKSSVTKQSYSLNNDFGFNYKLNNRLIWGSGAGMANQWSEVKTTEVRDQTFSGSLNTYFAYRMTPRVKLLLGTVFTHVYRDTDSYQDVTRFPNSIRTKGNNLQNVFLNADYRYSEKITFTGGFQGTLIDWDIGKIGGSVGVTYRRNPQETLSFKYRNSVIQDNTSMVLARTVTRTNGLGITLNRFTSMALNYKRQFDHGKTTCFLGVDYYKYAPLSGIYYGRSGDSGTINYDILFKAAIRRAILKNRASFGLLYSYEFAPNRKRNNVTGQHELTSNTSQNIIATLDYFF